MKVSKLLQLSLVSLLLSSVAAASAQTPKKPLYTDPVTGYTYALNDPTIPPDALKLPPPEKKKGPLKKMGAALGKELGTSFEDMGKDMVLIFSVQDVDPYEKKVNQSKPYELTQVRYIDGSGASVTHYPDNSLKMNGGFADGTVIVPMGGPRFDVLYPNGATGHLEKVPGGGAKIHRPDGTITTIARNMSGSFSVSNDKLGYMGLATPDQTGLRYEMATGSF